MDLTTFAAVAACVAAALFIVLFVLLRAKKDVLRGLRKKIGMRRKVATADVCGICFGSITNADMVARCGCGQTYHDVCANPTGPCPYCKAAYDTFTIETPDCIRCPSCGSDVVGNVCGCGAVVYRDGMFTCGCGEALDVNEPVCGRCGTEYDVCSGRISGGV